MTRLTKRRLRAIMDALAARLAGELDDDELEREDYEAAMDWADNELMRREFANVLDKAAPARRGMR